MGNQREQFDFLQFDRAIRVGLIGGLVEVLPSEVERAITLRLTEKGLAIFRSLDLSSQEEMTFSR